MAERPETGRERVTAEQLRKRAAVAYLDVENVSDDIAACLLQAAEDCAVLEIMCEDGEWWLREMIKKLREDVRSG